METRLDRQGATTTLCLSVRPTSPKIYTGMSYLLFSVVSDGCRMDYSEVSSAFCKLVETHFLQRCPPMAGAGPTHSATPATPATPAGTSQPTPESFPDCYRVPQVTLIGHGKRRLSSEDGEEQRNAKRAKMDSEVSV